MELEGGLKTNTTSRYIKSTFQKVELFLTASVTLNKMSTIYMTSVYTSQKNRFEYLNPDIFL